MGLFNPSDRALYIYKSKRGDQADLTHRIKNICETQVRCGYSRASMSCFGGMAGLSMPNASTGYGELVCHYATKRSSAGSKPSFGCSQLSISSRASLARWRHTFRGSMYSNGFASEVEFPATIRGDQSTESCRAILTFGLIRRGAGLLPAWPSR